MASTSEEDFLETALAGIPRIAEAVATNDEGARAKMLEAVEASYRQTARDFGYDENRIQGWVSTLMVLLRAEIAMRALAKQKVLEALQEELLRAPNSNVPEHKEARPVTAKRNRRRRSSRRSGLKVVRSASS